MRLVLCDCCGKEIKSRYYTFSYLCHLDKSLRNKCGYVDSEFNAISGREECKDLCIKCYNEIFLTSVLKFEELQKKYEDSDTDHE